MELLTYKVSAPVKTRKR